MRKPLQKFTLLLTAIAILNPSPCVSLVTNTTQYCQNIPLNPLITCNVTCDSCGQQGKCSTCQAYLQLSESTCRAPADQRISYDQYLNRTNLNADKSLVNFRTKQKGVLTNSDLFRLCIANVYRFDIVGLFSSQDDLSFTETYALTVSEIALNFRVFFTVDDIIVKVLINQKLLFERAINSGFTIDLVTNSTTSTGVIETNPILYVDSIFATIRTGMLPVGDSTAQIRIVVENGDSSQPRNQKFWGINQMSVVAKRCMTCVSSAIQQFAAVLGIIIGVSCGVVLVLLLVLAIYFKIKGTQYNNKLKKQFRETQDKYIPKTENMLPA